MRPRLAVFDMIGTTVQAGREVPEAFRGAFQSVGVTLSDDAVTQVRGRSKEEAIAELVRTHLPDTSDAAGLCGEIYGTFKSMLRDSYEAGAMAVPGARSTFERLMERDVQVVLTTGLDGETARRLLRGLAWEDVGLRGVLTGDDVKHGRPAPDLIHAAMALAGAGDPGSVMVVGDTVSDLEAATRADAGWIVGVLTGAHTREQLLALPHSVILETVARIPDWLDAAGAWT